MNLSFSRLICCQGLLHSEACPFCTVSDYPSGNLSTKARCYMDRSKYRYLKSESLR